MAGTTGDQIDKIKTTSLKTDDWHDILCIKGMSWMPQKRNFGKRRKIRPCCSWEVCEGTGDNAASITLAIQTLPVEKNYTLMTPNHTTWSFCHHTGHEILEKNLPIKIGIFYKLWCLAWIFCCISSWVVSMALKCGASQWLPGASLYPSCSTTDMRK